MKVILCSLAKLTNAIETTIHNRTQQRRLASYIKSNRRPWRTGYSEYKIQYLTGIIKDNKMLEKFLYGKPLPDGYGFRLDARVVEIPWIIARLAHRTGQLLDAGSSLNHEFVIQAPALANKRITMVTLAPETQCHWKLGISYVFGDLCDLDFRDDRFDTITCISTIEHVGMDNTMYAGTAEEMVRQGDTEAFLLAVKELKRVLKPGGALYITFPFGRYENHGWFQQFDAELTDTLVEGFDPRHFNETLFRYDPDGWKISERTPCANCEFFDIQKSKYFDPNSTVGYPSDYPAGERAVVCLELFK